MSAFDWLFSSRRFSPTRLVLRAGDNDPAARFNSLASQFFSFADRPRMRVSIFASDPPTWCFSLFYSFFFFFFNFFTFLLKSKEVRGFAAPNRPGGGASSTEEPQ